MLGIVLSSINFSFGQFFSELDKMDFFAYVLPFLLIFGVVYAILAKITVFSSNKGAAVLVSLAIGLLALQLDMVPKFFQLVFPNFGIGVALLLIALILSGGFISGLTGRAQTAYNWIFFGLGMLIFIIVTLSSFSDWQFIGSNWWDLYGPMVVVIFVIVGAVVGVILANKAGSTTG